MSFDEEFDKIKDSLLVEWGNMAKNGKANIRAQLMRKTREERFRVLREDYSLERLNTISRWALPEEDYEICQSVNEVKANNEKHFEVDFSYTSNLTDRAVIVKFRKPDGIYYYHADCVLQNGIDETVFNLFKNSEGVWLSQGKNNNAYLLAAVGKAIDCYENNK